MDYRRLTWVYYESSHTWYFAQFLPPTVLKTNTFTSIFLEWSTFGGGPFKNSSSLSSAQSSISERLDLV